jgi:DNA-binding NarL/FixJ family response regulator
VKRQPPSRILIAGEYYLEVLTLEALVKRHTDAKISAVVYPIKELFRVPIQEAPHFLLLWLPQVSQTEASKMIEQIENALPNILIILVGEFMHPLLARQLLCRGAKAYLYYKDSLDISLLTALKHVKDKRLYLSPTLNALYLYKTSTGQERLLSEEERTVLWMLAEGYTASEIAGNLNVIQKRIYRLYDKLRRYFQVQTNEAMIKQALLQGFIPYR